MTRPTLPSPLSFHATTANTLEGFDIVETFGVVRGITVRSRSLLGRVGALLQQLGGGEISILTELCEETRARVQHRGRAHEDPWRQRPGRGALRRD